MDDFTKNLTDNSVNEIKDEFLSISQTLKDLTDIKPDAIIIKRIITGKEEIETELTLQEFWNEELLEIRRRIDLILKYDIGNKEV